jgi:myosin heavy chain 6/7
MEKPLGIISMLDEECIVPKAMNLTLAQKLNEQHFGKHPNFTKVWFEKFKKSMVETLKRHLSSYIKFKF